MNQSKFLRNVAAVASLALGLACGDSDDRRAEAALLTADSEEGGVQGLLSLNYEITSDVFKKWKQAQLSLDRVLGRAQARSLKAAIIGTRPTREAIERSVARVESNARARRAIEQAGMSPRTYVVATVALFQATRGIDPLTGEAFRNVPARNVEFARQNRADTVGAGEFQQIADSIAAARAAGSDLQGVQVDTIGVTIDTSARTRPPETTPQPRPLPTPTPTPTPLPPPQPVPTPTPTPTDSGGADGL